MRDCIITKDYTTTKAKTDAKADVISVLFAALTDIYGDENVAMVRTGNGNSKTNEIGVVIGHAEVDGTTVPICATVNASAKDFVERKTKSKIFPAFDFAAAKETYDNYLEEKAAKDAEKEASKATKIAADAKKKAEAENDVDF